ncbi:MAG: hypothetical protein KC503_04660 [Myxococcales bacterium]|nr:hypothetical protein [Myxococcales bacterium]
MSIASIDAMMSRAQALAPELPSSPLCLVDLRELRRRPSAAQVRRLISGIRAANVRFEHLAFVIGSRTLAVAARFVARPLHGGRFSVHCELASAEAALCRARDRGQS